MALRSQLALLGIKCFLTLISFVIVLDVLRQGIEKNKRKDHMKEANVSTKKVCFLLFLNYGSDTGPSIFIPVVLFIFCSLIYFCAISLKTERF